MIAEEGRFVGLGWTDEGASLGWLVSSVKSEDWGKKEGNQWLSGGRRVCKIII